MIKQSVLKQVKKGEGEGGGRGGVGKFHIGEKGDEIIIVNVIIVLSYLYFTILFIVPFQT